LWQLDKGDFPENVHTCVRVKINKHSFEPFCVWITLGYLLHGLYIGNADVRCCQLFSLDAGVAVEHSKLSLRADGQVDLLP